MEPIVSRDVIRELARAAAQAGLNLYDNGVNPYPAGTSAHHRFEMDYQECVREIAGELEV